MLQLPSAAIPIPGVAVIALNLVQDSVNPSSGRVGLVFLHHFMGGIPFGVQGEVDGLEEMLLHNGLAENANYLPPNSTSMP